MLLPFLWQSGMVRKLVFVTFLAVALLMGRVAGIAEGQPAYNPEATLRGILEWAPPHLGQLLTTARLGRTVTDPINVLLASLPPLIVQSSLILGFGILAEAGISYLGLGIQPPTPSWGLLLADGRNQLTTSPHSSIFPGIAIVLTVLGFNLLGDGLRDVLDPRMSER